MNQSQTTNKLTEDTKITLYYNDILVIFGNTKMIKNLGIPQITGWATEIEERLESKLN